MADESEVTVQACCVITVACSLGAASLLINKMLSYSRETALQSAL